MVGVSGMRSAVLCFWFVVLDSEAFLFVPILTLSLVFTKSLLVFLFIELTAPCGLLWLLFCHGFMSFVKDNKAYLISFFSN